MARKVHLHGTITDVSVNGSYGHVTLDKPHYGLGLVKLNAGTIGRDLLQRQSAHGVLEEGMRVTVIECERRELGLYALAVQPMCEECKDECQ